jgi:hypothetical protein
MRVAEVLIFLRINLDILPAGEAPTAGHQMQAATFELLLLRVII